MDPNKQKEQYSLAYVHAVASVCGFKLSYQTPAPDDDGIDFTIGRAGGGGTARSPRVDVQIKCSGQDLLRPDGVHFPLGRKNYDDLRHTDFTVPRILIVVLVPTNVGDWCRTVPGESLTLYRNAWWVSLFGHPELPGVETPTVVLPRDHVFDPMALNAMLARIGQGGTP